MRDVRTWREFEVFAVEFIDHLVPLAIVTHDKRVRDQDGILHQVDVDIEIPVSTNPLRVMLDTKLWRDRVGKAEIQKLAKTRDQLGYHLAGVVANRLDGFSSDARKQAELDNVRLFDLSHWLVVSLPDGEVGLTGGGPFSDSFVAGTRVVSVVPLSEGPVFHHPSCVADCTLPDLDWITSAGASVRETIEHWIEDGDRVAVWRREARADASVRLGELDEGDSIARVYEVAFEEPVPLQAPKSAEREKEHLWRSYGFRTQISVLPAEAKRTEWFFRRLDDGDWRFLALLRD